MKREGTISVLLITDSSLFRRILGTALDCAGDIHVIGCGGTVEEVRAELLRHHPEVILLDLRLTTTDGLVMLRKLRMNYPVPLIVLAESQGRLGDRAVRALELGALEVVDKPASGKAPALEAFAQDLAQRIHAAVAQPRPPGFAAVALARPGSFRAAGVDPNRYVVALGASTGGTEAIATLLRRVPADFPPLVMVEHMPVAFTRPFAERLNGLSALRVTEAVDGDVLRAGCAYLARGDTQLLVRPAGDTWHLRYGDQRPVNLHCPSVDVLFESMVAVGARGVGILLTGMGADGARGLLRMRQAGALTIAQNEGSSVVYGMPKEAVALGAVMHSAAPQDIPELVLRCLQKRERRGAEVNARP